VILSEAAEHLLNIGTKTTISKLNFDQNLRESPTTFLASR